MSPNRSFMTVLMQSLIGVLFATSGTVALAHEKNMPQQQEQIMPQQQEEDPCPFNTGAIPPAEMPASASDPLCLSMPPDIARAAAEWKHPVTINVDVLSRPENGADVPAGTKFKTTLLPFKSVSLPAKPGKEVKVRDFAGLVSFRSGKAGTYRILLSQYAWLELIDPTNRLAGVLDSDKRLDTCSGMGRNVSFELAADTRYWLQMSGVKQGAEVEVMISAPR